MATMIANERKQGGRSTRAAAMQGRSVSHALRHKIDLLLAENYAYMDSSEFRHKNIEKELFDFETEPQLPLTSWYQPTRDDVMDSAGSSAPPLKPAGSSFRNFISFTREA